jgi:Zn-dependent M28 family amino/carboxypeptidase
MGKQLYKTYADLTNIVIRVSDGTPEGREHAALVSAHLNSTLPGPGVVDDALSISVMLDCICMLTHTPGWTPSHTVIFCERLFDLFSSMT